MFGEYKTFKTKFPDSYSFYGIDLNNPAKDIRDDITAIPEAIELGYTVKEGHDFGACNVFEKQIALGVFDVVWSVIVKDSFKWKKDRRINGVYVRDGKLFKSLSEALKCPPCEPLAGIWYPEKLKENLGII